VKSTANISRLVLAGAVGIKVGDRETRDIADIFQRTEANLNKALFATAAPRVADYKSMADADVLTIARNRESLARYAWSPYMHNPKLKGRLHRINIPTLILWGAQDGVVSREYGQAYAAAIPNAKFVMVDNAGHLPQIDQPQAFARQILDFTADAQGVERKAAGGL
jgi:pimeloyl-ACP methyl ester carboxylesterase